jgi:hypothetical protein
MYAANLHDRARTLLVETLAVLRDTHGYTQIRVDTYTQRDGNAICHHYAGGEYSLTRKLPNGETRTARWDARHELPTVDQILAQL